MGWVLGCVLVGCGGGAAADAGALVDEDSAPVLEHDAGDAGALVDEDSAPVLEHDAGDAGALVDEDSAPVFEHDAGDAGALVDEASPPAADAGDAGELVDAGACLVITGTVCAVAGYPYYRFIEGPGGRGVSECCTTP